MDFLISAIVNLVVSALILIVVDRLNLGLSVGGFMNAVIAAIGIAIANFIVLWLVTAAGLDLSDNNMIVAAIVYLLVAAAGIWLASIFLPGFSTDGFTGAIVAAIAIAVIVWIVDFVIAMFQ
ncbi:MAG: phage holin family protein [Anaerolineae bacterium]